MKLYADEITILSEKELIKKAIIGKFGSIDEFADKIEISRGTILNYLSGNSAISGKFKLKLSLALDKDYYEVALEPKKQIKNYIDNINDNVKFYDSINILPIYEKIKGLCIIHELYEDIGKLDYILGELYYKSGIVDIAFNYFVRAINMIETNGCNPEYLIEIFTGTANKAYKYKNNDLAIQYYNKAFDLLSRSGKSISNKNKYFLYYDYGIYLRGNGKCKEAIVAFEQAIAVTEEMRGKAAAISCIGVIYKQEGDYDKAIALQENAIEVIGDTHNLTKVFFYNNLAEVLRLNRNLDEATTCIKKAYELLSNTKDDDRELNLYHTYAHICIDKGEYGNIFDEMLRYIREKNKSTANKKYVLRAIDLLIEIAETKKDSTDFQQIEELVVDLIRSNKDEISVYFLKDLKVCLVDIILKTQYK